MAALDPDAELVATQAAGVAVARQHPRDLGQHEVGDRPAVTVDDDVDLVGASMALTSFGLARARHKTAGHMSGTMRAT